MPFAGKLNGPENRCHPERAVGRSKDLRFCRGVCSAITWNPRRRSLNSVCRMETRQTLPSRTLSRTGHVSREAQQPINGSKGRRPRQAVRTTEHRRRQRNPGKQLKPQSAKVRLGRLSAGFKNEPERDLKLALNDFAGLDAAGAHAHPLARSANDGLDRLQIHVPATTGGVVGVRDVVAELRALAAEITFLRHVLLQSLVAGSFRKDNALLPDREEISPESGISHSICGGSGLNRSATPKESAGKSKVRRFEDPKSILKTLVVHYSKRFPRKGRSSPERASAKATGA